MADIPDRWRTRKLDDFLDKIRTIGAASEKDDGRQVWVALADENGRAEWSARNCVFGGNMLVTLSYQEHASGTNLAEEYVALTTRLRDLSTAILPVSRFVFLLLTERDTTSIFNTILQSVSIRHHSFCVIDLSRGSGLAWDTGDGKTVEIEPARVERS